MSGPADPAYLEQLWSQLQRSEESEAPQGCHGLVYVPFRIQSAWFNEEFRLRVSGWMGRSRREYDSSRDRIEPFGTIEGILAELPAATRIRRHHLACCGIEIPAEPNSVLSVWYETPAGKRWTALPGVSYEKSEPSRLWLPKPA